MNPQNKVAWISGGARMGQAIGLALAERGYIVILTWLRSKDKAEQAANSIKAKGGQAHAMPCDTTSARSIDASVRAVTRQFGRLNLLVNMASIFDLGPLTGKKGEWIWNQHMKVHAESAFLVSRAFAPLMKRSAPASLVHISDWTPASGRPRYKDYGGYYVSKAAVKALVEVLALELAPEIRVNALAPGPILPPPRMSQKEYEAVRKATPLGRWGSPEDMAGAIVFLAENQFITGETIRIDGGRHLY